MFLVGSIITCLDATIIISFLVTVLIMILPTLSIVMNIHAFLSSSAGAYALFEAVYSSYLLLSADLPSQSQNLISKMEAFG